MLHLHRHLLRQTQNIGRIRPRRLQAQTILALQSLGHLRHIGKVAGREHPTLALRLRVSLTYKYVCIECTHVTSQNL
jgi:hypothetical protein